MINFTDNNHTILIASPIYLQFCIGHFLHEALSTQLVCSLCLCSSSSPLAVVDPYMGMFGATQSLTKIQVLYIGGMGENCYQSSGEYQKKNCCRLYPLRDSFSCDQTLQ